jgi:hypothetical protein
MFISKNSLVVAEESIVTSNNRPRSGENGIEFPTHPYSTPCRLPSLTRPVSPSRDSHPQGVIAIFKMIAYYITFYKLNLIPGSTNFVRLSIDTIYVIVNRGFYNYAVMTGAYSMGYPRG